MRVLQSDREWLWWGRHDPLWAVNSVAGKEGGRPGAWTHEEFLESGRRYFADVAVQWGQYGMGRSHVAEIGCGAGRITSQLLGFYDRVTAIDISTDQLALARVLIGARAERVRFVTPDPNGLIAPGPYDGVFSCEVFQHFSTFDGIESYCAAAYRELQPGGTICFQLPVWSIQEIPVIRYVALRVARAIKRATGGRRMMEYRAYSASRVLAMLRRVGFDDCQLRVFPVADHDAGHSYFFGRKIVRS